jgi:hypothetical protein
MAGFEVDVADRRQADLLEGALAALGTEPSSLRAWVLARLSVAITRWEGLERRDELSREAVAMARRIADPRAEAYALSSLCDAMAGPDHVEERLAAAGAMIRRAREAGDPEMELLGRRFQVVALLERGRVAEVDAEIEAFAQVAGPLRQPLSAWYVPLWRGMRALMNGDVQTAADRVAEVRVIGARAFSENAGLLADTLQWTIVHLCREDTQTLAEPLKKIDGWLGWPSARVGAGAYLLEMGLAAQARSMIEPVLQDPTGTSRDSEWLTTMSSLAETSFRLQIPDADGTLRRLIGPYADLFAVDGIAAACHGSMRQFLAMLEALAGRAEEAGRHFEAALAAHRRIGATSLSALTLANWATAWSRLPEAASGARVGGQTLVELASEARELFESIGAAERAREMEELASGISSGTSASAGQAAVTSSEPAATAGPLASEPAGRIEREGDVWAVGWHGSTARLRDSKGLRDLAVLLSRPGVEVHVMELATSGRADRTAASDRDLLAPVGPSDQELIDPKARAAYRARLEELAEEIAEAKMNNDQERAARARVEIEFLEDELTAATGLGGRTRHLSDDVERARKAVAARLRDAIRRIDKELPSLGRHLERSVRTGTFCSYDPAEPEPWVVRP